MTIDTATAAGTSSSSLLILTGSQNPLPRRYPHPQSPALLIPPLIHRTLHTALDQDPPSALISTETDGTASTGSTSSSSSSGQQRETLIIPHPDTLVKHDSPTPFPSVSSSSTDSRVNGDAGHSERNTGGSSSEVIGATLDSAQPPVARESHDGHTRSDEVDSEVTVKLHLVGSSAQVDTCTRLKWVERALSALATYKGLSDVDTLLIGMKGVDYRGKKTETSGCQDAELDRGSSSGEVVDHETEKAVLDLWKGICRSSPKLNGNGDEGTGSRAQADLPNGDGPAAQKKGEEDLKSVMSRVGRLGTLYMPLGLLKALGETGTPPSINSMDTPDCHHLPKEYTDFAKSMGIELWAGGGGEGSDPMPSKELHNVLQEFNTTINPLLPLPDSSSSSSQKSKSLSTSLPASDSPAPPIQAAAATSSLTVLDNLIPLKEDGSAYVDDIEPDVCVDWVLGYTLVSKTRNVLEDKGYIVSADWTS